MIEWKTGLTIFTVIGAPALGLYLSFKAYGGENGERYRKRRMQGPFVPLSAEDIAEDDARIRQRKNEGKL
ncbi:MAG TPA: hypothetical protein VJ577_10690 [Burkholderiaceae bacterium]|nr:hypothetical protein [Burkholderiaceae bacterium]